MQPALKTILATGIAAFALAHVGAAQTAAPAPDLGRRHREELHKSYRIDQRIESGRRSFGGVEIESPQPALPAEGVSAEKVLDLKQVDFSPEPQVIPAAAVHQAAARYIGTRVSMRDLYDLLATIDRLYDQAGVLGRAVLPVQDVNDGTVTIQLIEARLGKVTVSGGRRHRDRYVTRAVPLRSGEFIRVAKLERSLLRYNAAHDSKLQAELAAGSDFGATDVIIKVAEPTLFSGTAFADNSGRTSTGRLRIGFFAATRSALGRDDTFSIGADASQGWTGANAAYRQPITRWGTFLDGEVDWSRFRLVDGGVESLGVDGDSNAYKVGLTQLLWAGRRWSLAADVGYGERRSSTRFEGTELLAEDLGLLSLGFAFRWEDEKGMIEFSPTAWLAGDHSEFGNDFFFLSGSLLGVRWFGRKWTLIGRVTGQWVRDEIISSQQFQIGGTATVRGFEEGLLFGESGGAATVELRRALVAGEKYAVEALTFADYGGVYSKDSPTKRYRQLTSVGVGVNASLHRRLSVRIAYAHPIKPWSNLEAVQTPAHGRVHLSIQSAF